jgi:hypothetical protein
MKWVQYFPSQRTAGSTGQHNELGEFLLGRHMTKGLALTG